MNDILLVENREPMRILLKSQLEYQNYVVEEAPDYDKNVTKISREAEKYFLNYPWKGNVRKFKNTVNSIIPFKKNKTIDLDDLSYSVIEGKKNNDKQLPTLEEYEKEYILKVFEVCDFNISLVAEVLGINRPRLYRKIKFYRLEKEFK